MWWQKNNIYEELPKKGGLNNLQGTWRSKEVGFFKFIIWREGEKPQARGFFMGHHKKTAQEVDHWTTLSRITYSFSLLWCKKIYALHKIPSYLNLISKKVWFKFLSWIYFYLHYKFFHQSANDNWMSISLHRHRKIILTLFFPCDFTIVTADVITYYTVCL